MTSAITWHTTRHLDAGGLELGGVMPVGHHQELEDGGGLHLPAQHLQEATSSHRRRSSWRHLLTELLQFQERVLVRGGQELVLLTPVQLVTTGARIQENT